MGIVYSGNIYTVIDSEMPKERVEKIFATLDPAAIVADRDNFDSAQQYGIEVFLIDNLKQTEINSEVLNSIRSYQTENDPLYILYTSGSTGMPKGTVINHKNVLTYSKWAVDEFSIDEKTVFGN